MTYLELYEKATRLLDNGEITIGEYEEMIKPLKREICEWTPVSEEPKDSGNYLITVVDLRLGHLGEHTVTMAEFYAKAKKWNSIVDVYAWMPLPKPYREDGEEYELATEQMEHDAMYEPTYNSEDGSM